jgi:pimeloyl-ACP methyl ester carboxylesterase
VENVVSRNRDIKASEPAEAARTPAPTHTDAIVAVHQQMLAKSPAHLRHIAAGSGHQIHVIEAGEGPPLVLLHGSGPTSLMFLPLIERLTGLRAIAVDRPGFGLSDPIDLPLPRYREAVIEYLDSILDALGLDQTSLLGSSIGGTWAVWYALAHPNRLRRLVLLGAPPLLPGTRVPPVLRLIFAPRVAEYLSRRTPWTAKSVVDHMAVMGEGDTILNYPHQIEALVAGGRDPLAAAAGLAEHRVYITPFGFRRALKMQREELQQLTAPTLLIWGEHDPLGSAKTARGIADALPHAHLEMLPAGHGPWLGHPDRTAHLVSNVVR